MVNGTPGTPCCPPLFRGALTKTEADRLAVVFKALADVGRLRLLSFIAAQPDGQACVGRMTPTLGLTQPTVSHHLKVLIDAGLLERERRGTWAYYRLIPARLEEIGEALMTSSGRLKRRASV